MGGYLDFMLVTSNLWSCYFQFMKMTTQWLSRICGVEISCHSIPWHHTIMYIHLLSKEFQRQVSLVELFKNKKIIKGYLWIDESLDFLGNEDETCIHIIIHSLFTTKTYWGPFSIRLQWTAETTSLHPYCTRRNQWRLMDLFEEN